VRDIYGTVVDEGRGARTRTAVTIQLMIDLSTPRAAGEAVPLRRRSLRRLRRPGRVCTSLEELRAAPECSPMMQPPWIHELLNSEEPRGGMSHEDTATESHRAVCSIPHVAPRWCSSAAIGHRQCTSRCSSSTGDRVSGEEPAITAKRYRSTQPGPVNCGDGLRGCPNRAAPRLVEPGHKLCRRQDRVWPCRSAERRLCRRHLQRGSAPGSGSWDHEGGRQALSCSRLGDDGGTVAEGSVPKSGCVYCARNDMDRSPLFGFLRTRFTRLTSLEVLCNKLANGSYAPASGPLVVRRAARSDA
jgi:hypothetical protein